MITTNTYLNFKGNCEEAFKAYERILGGKIIALIKPQGTPMASHVAPDFQDKVMHVRMSLGGAVIMGSDTPHDNFQVPQGFSVNIGVDTSEEADRIYAALAEGGTQIMPIAETFWAHRFGMCVDRFGTPWMVNCENPM